jgi:AcrR family transcriptional regulator
MPNLHQRKSAASRARILQAAFELFVAQGYTGTSIRQIAERAGLTPGGIYAQFANKEVIWSLVFHQHHPYRDILPVMEAAQGDTIETLLLDAARRLVDSLGQREDLLNLMFTELVEFKGRNLPALVNEIVPRAIGFIQRIYTTGEALRPISPPVVARAFLGLFFSYYMTEKMIPAEYRPAFGHTSLEQFIQIFLHGIIEKEDGHD